MGLVYRVHAGYNTRPGKSGELVSVLYNETKRKRLDVPLLYAHGLEVGSSPWAHWHFPTPHTVPRKLAEIGMICASADFGGGQTWGNDEAHLSIPELLAYLATHYGTDPDTYAIWMGSMGGLTGLNRIWRVPAQLKVGALSIPAINIQSIHTLNILGMAASIEAAYGGNAAYLAALPTRSPHLNASLVSPVASKLMCWYSNNDNVCLKTHTEAFLTASGVVGVNTGDWGHSQAPGYDMDMIEWLYQGARAR